MNTEVKVIFGFKVCIVCGHWGVLVYVVEMVSRGALLLTCHGLVWVGAIAMALWAGGARAAAVRYDTATPYAPPYNKYKYIPIQ